MMITIIIYIYIYTDININTILSLKCLTGTRQAYKLLSLTLFTLSGRILGLLGAVAVGPGAAVAVGAV